MFFVKVIVGTFVFFFGSMSLVLAGSLVSSLLKNENRLSIITLMGAAVYTLSAAITSGSGAYALFVDWSAISFALISFAVMVPLSILLIGVMVAQHYRPPTPELLALEELGEDRTLPQLLQVVQLIHQSDLEHRRRTLRNIATTCRKYASELDIDKRYLFDRMLQKLALSVDVPAREELAKMLADQRFAPMGIIRMLAHDENILVAGPILRTSARLDDSDLIAIAKIADMNHVAAIAERPGLSESVARAVATRGLKLPGYEVAANLGNAPAGKSERYRSELRAKASALLLVALPNVLFWGGFAGLAHVLVSWAVKAQALDDPHPDLETVVLAAVAAFGAVLGFYFNFALKIRRSLFVGTNWQTYYLGWSLYLIGMFLMLIVCALSVASFFDENPFDPSTSSWLVTMGVGLTFLQWGSLLAVTNRFIPLAQTIRAKDRRPPITYLRSFSRESRGTGLKKFFRREIGTLTSVGRLAAVALKAKDNPEFVERDFVRNFRISQSIAGSLTAANIAQSIASGRGRVYDEQLVIANLMNRIGPYVAIGRPTETFQWADVGAAKMYVDDAVWQSTILELIAESAAIVIEGADSVGLGWEMQQVVQKASPIKVLMVVPQDDIDYASLKRECDAIFPVPFPLDRPVSRLMMFTENWLPVPVEVLAVENLSDGFVIDPLSNSLRAFIRQNGFELAPSRSLRDKIVRWVHLHMTDHPSEEMKPA